MVKNYLENLPAELKGKEGTYEEILEDLHNHSADISDDEEKKIWDVGVTAVDNLYKYNAPTWYEWCNDNWNTKWNACGYDENTDYSDSDFIWFQTAWSAPIPVIKKLSEMYPNIELTLEFADEDLGQNCGEMKFKGGDIIEEYIPHTGKEAMEFAAKVWDYDLADFQLHLNATGTDYIYTGESDYELIELFGNHFNSDCVNAVIKEFGFDRVNFILRYNLKKAQHDTRYSAENREWGKGLCAPDSNMRTEYLINEYAVFEIYAAEDITTLDGTTRYYQGELVDEITTGKDGIAKSKQLYLGKYTVVEKTAPSGFVNANEQYDVELTYAGQNVSVTSTALSVYNDRQKVSVSLLKELSKDERFKLGRAFSYFRC